MFQVYQPLETFLPQFPVVLSPYSISVIFIHIALRFVYMHFVAVQSKET